MANFPEHDWQQMRSIKDKVLARYCTAVLTHLRELADPDNPAGPHEAYLQIWRYMHDRDDLLEVLFDDWRRSNAMTMLLGWSNRGLMTEAEFEALSEETKTRLHHITDVIFYEHP
jgi:hypothetical protein